jgi:hypothetical protein
VFAYGASVGLIRSGSMDFDGGGIARSLAGQGWASWLNYEMKRIGALAMNGSWEVAIL